MSNRNRAVYFGILELDDKVPLMGMVHMQAIRREETAASQFGAERAFGHDNAVLDDNADIPPLSVERMNGIAIFRGNIPLVADVDVGLARAGVADWNTTCMIRHYAVSVHFDDAAVANADVAIAVVIHAGDALKTGDDPSSFVPKAHFAVAAGISVNAEETGMEWAVVDHGDVSHSGGV